MTSLFNFNRRTPASGGVIYAQDINNIENALVQMLGIIDHSSNAITGITTINIGAYLQASGSASNGITIWNKGSLYMCPSGGVASGNVIELLNGTDMAIAAVNGNKIVFNSSGAGSDATLAFSDITTNNTSSARHGFAPKTDGNQFHFLNSAGTPSYTAISGEVLTLYDSIINNSNSTNHGFAPKTPANSAMFLDGSTNSTYRFVSGEVLALADLTTNDVNSTRHGFAPKNSGNQFTFLNGANSPSYTVISGEVLTLYDSTINDFSTTKHGFVPKGTNVGNFLKDDGSWGSSDSGRTRYILTGAVFARNTISTIDLIGTGATGKGSLTFTANTLTAGKVIRITMTGIQDSNGATEAATGRIAIGSVNVAETTDTIGIGASSSGMVTVDVVITMLTDGVNGQCITQGRIDFIKISSFEAKPLNLFGNISTIDTTISQTLAFNWNWGSANTNTYISIKNAVVELLG